MDTEQTRTGIRIFHGLEVLSEDEAVRLASTVAVGRVGYTRFAMPAIHVVNFALDGDKPVFRTRKGAKFAAAIADTPVAFEVDRIDEEHHCGWTVSFIGRAHLVTDAAEHERLQQMGITPWAGGDRDWFIRIETQIVTGRRIKPDEGDADDQAGRDHAV